MTSSAGSAGIGPCSAYIFHVCVDSHLVSAKVAASDAAYVQLQLGQTAHRQASSPADSMIGNRWILCVLVPQGPQSRKIGCKMACTVPGWVKSVPLQRYTSTSCVRGLDARSWALAYTCNAL